MAENIWCQVQVKSPPNWGEHDGVKLLREALLKGDCTHIGEVWTVNGFGSWGLHGTAMTAALKWLRDRHVPYVATDETKSDLIGSIQVFDGDDLIEGRYDSTVTLSIDGYRSICAGESEFATVDDYFKACSRSIDEMSIEHLD